MMLMMTGHFSPKLVSQILRAVVQQKPVMKSMKACFPHSLSNSTDISESQIYWAGVKWNNGKCELKRAVLHNIDCNITAGNLMHIIACRVHVVTVHGGISPEHGGHHQLEGVAQGGQHGLAAQRVDEEAACRICGMQQRITMLSVGFVHCCHEPAKHDIMAETQLARGCSLLVASKPSPRSARSAWIRAVNEPPRNLTEVGSY